MDPIAKKYLKGYKSPIIRTSPPRLVRSGRRIIGWTAMIVHRKGFNIFIHAARMARAEFGCVSNHELALLARLGPKRPARLEPFLIT